MLWVTCQLSGGWQLQERGLAGSGLSVCFLGSQAWSSGMNLVFILRKFIFDSGRAGEEVNDRKRREGSETLWGCPTTPQAAPWPRQQEDEAKHQNQTFLLLFFLSSKLRDDSEAKSSSHSTTDLVAHEKM